MKISKLLIGTLIVALAIPAFTSEIQLSKDIAAADPDAYLVGQTVHFECTVSNPGTNTFINTLTAIWDVLPGGSIVWLVSPGSGVDPSAPDPADPPLVQDPGDSQTYFVNYVVAAGDLIDLGGGYTGVTNRVFIKGTDSDTPPQILEAGTSKSAVVRSPDISIDKVGSIEAFCLGDEPEVTYTYYVENTGDEDLTEVVVTDDKCTSPTYSSGDDGDGVLEPGEIWVYECSMPIIDTTENEAEVTAVGVETGAEVDDIDWLEIEAVEPPEVEVVIDPLEICEGGSAEACAEVSGGSGEYAYLWNTGAETVCIDVSEDGEYCVAILDLVTGCVAEACARLTVNPNPSCELAEVEPPVCPSEGGNFVTAIVGGGTPPYTLEWSIEGAGWAIVGGQGTDTLEYSVAEEADECAIFTLTVTDEAGCTTECEIEICCAGEMACGFTQGFYGNVGGKACGGKSTVMIITEALVAAGGSIIVGVPGSGSIEFSTADCIIIRLPAGGPPKELKDDYTCVGLPPKMLKKDRIRNVAVGQAVALTLNLLLEGCHPDASPLGLMIIPEGGVLCTIGEGEDCPETYTFPESTWGLSAAEVLADLNKALAGEPTDSGASLEELSDAADGFNNAFDECRSVVSCSLLRPDLIVTALEVLDYTSDPFWIQYGYTVQNIGCSAVDLDGVAVQAMLSDDTVFNNGGDIPAGGVVLSVGEYLLAPGATISGSWAANTTLDPADFDYLTLMVDWGDSVDELDEANNTAAAAIVPIIMPMD